MSRVGGGSVPSSPRAPPKQSLRPSSQTKAPLYASAKSKAPAKGGPLDAPGRWQMRTGVAEFPRAKSPPPGSSQFGLPRGTSSPRSDVSPSRYGARSPRSKAKAKGAPVRLHDLDTDRTSVVGSEASDDLERIDHLEHGSNTRSSYAMMSSAVLVDADPGTPASPATPSSPISPQQTLERRRGRDQTPTDLQDSRQSRTDTSAAEMPEDPNETPQLTTADGAPSVVADGAPSVVPAASGAPPSELNGLSNPMPKASAQGESATRGRRASFFSDDEDSSDASPLRSFSPRRSAPGAKMDATGKPIGSGDLASRLEQRRDLEKRSGASVSRSPSRGTQSDSDVEGSSSSRLLADKDSTRATNDTENESNSSTGAQAGKPSSIALSSDRELPRFGSETVSEDSRGNIDSQAENSSLPAEETPEEDAAVGKEFSLNTNASVQDKNPSRDQNSDKHEDSAVADRSKVPDAKKEEPPESRVVKGSPKDSSKPDLRKQLKNLEDQTSEIESSLSNELEMQRQSLRDELGHTQAISNMFQEAVEVEKQRRLEEREEFENRLREELNACEEKWRREVDALKAEVRRLRGNASKAVEAATRGLSTFIAMPEPPPTETPKDGQDRVSSLVRSSIARLSACAENSSFQGIPCLQGKQGKSMEAAWPVDGEERQMIAKFVMSRIAGIARNLANLEPDADIQQVPSAGKHEQEAAVQAAVQSARQSVRESVKRQSIGKDASIGKDTPRDNRGITPDEVQSRLPPELSPEANSPPRSRERNISTASKPGREVAPSRSPRDVQNNALPAQETKPSQVSRVVQDDRSSKPVLPEQSLQGSGTAGAPVDSPRKNRRASKQDQPVAHDAAPRPASKTVGYASAGPSSQAVRGRQAHDNKTPNDGNLLQENEVSGREAAGGDAGLMNIMETRETGNDCSSWDESAIQSSPTRGRMLSDDRALGRSNSAGDTKTLSRSKTDESQNISRSNTAEDVSKTWPARKSDGSCASAPQEVVGGADNSRQPKRSEGHSPRNSQDTDTTVLLDTRPPRRSEELHLCDLQDNDNAQKSTTRRHSRRSDETHLRDSQDNVHAHANDTRQSRRPEGHYLSAGQDSCNGYASDTRQIRKSDGHPPPPDRQDSAVSHANDSRPHSLPQSGIGDHRMPPGKMDDIAPQMEKLTSVGSSASRETSTRCQQDSNQQHPNQQHSNLAVPQPSQQVCPSAVPRPYQPDPLTQQPNLATPRAQEQVHRMDWQSMPLTEVSGHRRPDKTPPTEQAAVCRSCRGTGTDFTGQACTCSAGRQNRTPQRTGQVSCRSCKNTGTDFLGQPCACGLWQNEIQNHDPPQMPQPPQVSPSPLQLQSLHRKSDRRLPSVTRELSQEMDMLAMNSPVRVRAAQDIPPPSSRPASQISSNNAAGLEMLVTEMEGIVAREGKVVGHEQPSCSSTSDPMRDVPKHSGQVTPPAMRSSSTPHSQAVQDPRNDPPPPRGIMSNMLILPPPTSNRRQPDPAGNNYRSQGLQPDSVGNSYRSQGVQPDSVGNSYRSQGTSPRGGVPRAGAVDFTDAMLMEDPNRSFSASATRLQLTPTSTATTPRPLNRSQSPVGHRLFAYAEDTKVQALAAAASSPALCSSSSTAATATATRRPSPLASSASAPGMPTMRAVRGPSEPHAVGFATPPCAAPRHAPAGCPPVVCPEFQAPFFKRDQCGMQVPASHPHPEMVGCSFANQPYSSVAPAPVSTPSVPGPGPWGSQIAVGRRLGPPHPEVVPPDFARKSPIHVRPEVAGPRVVQEPMLVQMPIESAGRLQHRPAGWR